MGRPQYWTDTRIIAAVQTFVQQHGRIPTRREFCKGCGLPDRRIVERRMRSWQAPLRAILLTEDVSAAVAQGPGEEG